MFYYTIHVYTYTLRWHNKVGDNALARTFVLNSIAICAAHIHEARRPAPQPLLVAAACLARLLMHCEEVGSQNHSGTTTTTHHLDEKIFSIVVGLARLPQFSSLARAPPLAFSLGWQPGLVVEQQVVLGSPLPSSLLQEQDVLQQLIWRLNILGWAGRAQFEETWMCLLSVLNVSSHQEDFTNEEVRIIRK